ARPCRARIRPAAELDGRQDCAHHWHRAGEVQDWHDEPRLQHPPAGSARADGSCTRLSALTGGLRVASCKGPRGRRPGVKTVPDQGLTSAQALQPLAQLRQKSPKASIVRGSHNTIEFIVPPPAAEADANEPIEIWIPLGAAPVELRLCLI